MEARSKPEIAIEGVSESVEAARISGALREVIDVSHRFEEMLQRSLNVNATDLVAMEHLIRDRELSPGELSRRLGVSSAAATMVVDRLAALGHVTRTPHPSDRRRVVVRPADASVALALAGLAPLLAGLAEVTESMTEQEQATVTKFLEDVLEVYSQSVDAAN